MTCPASPVLLFAMSFLFNVILGLICFYLFGGRDLLGKRDRGHGLEDSGTGGSGVRGAKMPDTPRDDPERRAARRSVQTTMVKDEGADEQVTTLDRNRIITLIGLIVLAVMVVPPLNQDVGFTAICIAVVISLFSPKVSKGAVSKVAWPTVLLDLRHRHLRGTARSVWAPSTGWATRSQAWARRCSPLSSSASSVQSSPRSRQRPASWVHSSRWPCRSS